RPSFCPDHQVQLAFAKVFRLAPGIDHSDVVNRLPNGAELVAAYAYASLCYEAADGGKSTAAWIDPGHEPVDEEPIDQVLPQHARLDGDQPRHGIDRQNSVEMGEADDQSGRRHRSSVGAGARSFRNDVNSRLGSGSDDRCQLCFSGRLGNANEWAAFGGAEIGPQQ